MIVLYLSIDRQPSISSIRRDLIPSVKTDYFEAFRPIFEFIESKIKIEQI
jgi:hypothetical protein